MHKKICSVEELVVPCIFDRGFPPCPRANKSNNSEPVEVFFTRNHVVIAQTTRGSFLDLGVVVGRES